MKTHTSITRATTCLMAVALMAVAAATTGGAAPALNGLVTLRPLTPQDIKDYSLTGLQGASGLNAVGVGQPAYLEALVNIAIAPSNITSVTWVLTNKPIGSTATLASSPLGPNVPLFNMADRSRFQVAGRTLLRPDIAGQYTVVATIVTAGSGTTNLTQNISGANYLGVQVCAFCHSGGVAAENVYTSYTNTRHASFFTRQIDGGDDPATSHYGKNCISCHTVGYDANTNAVNGGFDDVAKQLGWTFPTNLTAGNWAAMPTELKNLANIQCENCHGPGSEHAYAFGQTNLSNWPRLGVSFAAGNCGQCHDSKNNHVKNAEWNNSGHAVAPRQTGTYCVRCHTAPGFANYVNGKPAVSTPYEAITCAACHDPHDATNPYQLRAGTTITLGEGTTVTNAGLGAFCMNCHQSRNGSVTNSLVNWPLGLPTWAGGSSFGLHDACQADMLMGVNGATYGQDIPSSAHRFAVTNTCVGCHMQSVASTDPAFTKAGGHTTKMSYEVVTSGVTNVVHKVDVCVKCHGPMDSFNIAIKDYNGDGIIEGVQTEVSKLKDKLSTLIPNAQYRADGNYVADGLVKQSTSEKTNWQARFLSAAYNFRMVRRDTSLGIHNTAYTVGLLKASIADLTGDSNNDGLSDAWQIQYFGSATAPNAAPNATPAGDGIPNWLKHGLGLDPTVPGKTIPGGVVWYDNGRMGGSTNTIQIFTAAEVAFDTEVGKTYQLQVISSIGGTWENLGDPIEGTGAAVSYVTKTRSDGLKQQYYRVVTQ